MRLTAEVTCQACLLLLFLFVLTIGSSPSRLVFAQVFNVYGVLNWMYRHAQDLTVLLCPAKLTGASIIYKQHAPHVLYLNVVY